MIHDGRRAQTLHAFGLRLARLTAMAEADALAAFELLAWNVCRRLPPAEARDFAAQLPALMRERVLCGLPGPDRHITLGSIERDVAAKQVRFHVQGEPPHAGGAPGQPLAVVFDSLETPDLFKDGAEVVVEGRLSEAGDVFHADKVMAKCPSKFESAAGRPAAV